MKRLVPFITLVIFLFLSISVTANAKDLKIGYVSVDKIMGESDAAKAVKAELDEKVETIKKNLAAKEDEFKKLVEAYQDQKAVMKEEVLIEKERELAEKDMEYKRLVQAAELGLKEDLKKYDVEMLNDIKAIIEKLGEKKGYDIVFDEMMGGIVYIDSKKHDDLTDEVLKAYNKEFKKKK